MASKAKNRNRETTDRAAEQAIQQANTETPLQIMARERAQRFFDHQDSKGEFAGKAFDITTAPGMEPAMQVYGNAARKAGVARLGGGAMNLADKNSSYIAGLAQQAANDRYNDTALGLSEAYQNAAANAQGLADQSTQQTIMRNQANLQARFADREAFHRFKKRNPWETVAGLAIGGLGAAGSLMSGAGAMGLKF